MKSLIAVVVLSCSTFAAADELTVPASTAYLNPDTEGVRIAVDGITHWNDPQTSINWYGRFPQPGSLQATVQLALPNSATSTLTLTVGGQTQQTTVTGKGKDTVTADFGPFQITEAGYTSFQLRSLNKPGQPNGDVTALVLKGDAVTKAHFNLKPRRNAASVHLFYPVAKETQVSAFYCEMTGVEDPLWTYYMACGWHRGYFGMQVNSPTERRIIFSVWDSGNEAVDRKNVAADNRVTLVAKGEGVYSGEFGNEGTGGHSHLKYGWKTGEKQKFLVTAKPVDETHTVYSGYYFHPDRQSWMLISSWKAPKEGGYMRGLYSFSENFIGRNGHVVRKALYGNQWLRTATGDWQEITTARFSHDPTGKSDRRDRFMGLENGQFFLSHGGFVDGFTEFGSPFTRPATGDSPATMGVPK
ncbi:MAG: DUF3472 domain-containing protein [Planctomycetaceae bacterium]